MQEVGRDYAVSAAKDQSLFREVNERMRDLNEAFEATTRTSEFICECPNRDCVEHIVLTLDEYEEIRRVPTHFLVLPGPNHLLPEVERVVEKREGYVVVEKFGEAGTAAVKLDPRRRGLATAGGRAPTSS